MVVTAPCLSRKSLTRLWNACSLAKQSRPAFRCGSFNTLFDDTDQGEVYGAYLGPKRSARFVRSLPDPIQGFLLGGIELVVRLDERRDGEFCLWVETLNPVCIVELPDGTTRIFEKGPGEE